MGKHCTFATEQARRHLTERVRVMRRHIPAARQHDPEGVHELRVASRRLRATLSEHRPALGKAARQEVQEMGRAVTQGLGRARELDVMLGLLIELREPLKGLPRLAVNDALQCLRGLREEVSAELAEAIAQVESPAFDAALLSAFGSLQAPRQCYLKHARKRLDKRWRRLCALYDAWMAECQDEQLHELRKAAKKFRYSCELYAEVYPEALEQFAQGLKSVQQDLGNWNDYRLLQDELRHCAAKAGRRPAGGYEEVIETIGERALEHRERFEAHAAAFFDARNRAAAQAIFRQPAQACCG